MWDGMIAPSIHKGNVGCGGAYSIQEVNVGGGIHIQQTVTKVDHIREAVNIARMRQYGY